MAFRAIEDANPRLRGVFQDVDFANRERFPDSLLEQLLQHFEKYRLRNCDVDSNVLGDAYEYLIAKFADDAGKKGGEFFTPKYVVRLMVEMLKPEEGMTVYDPTCGSGGMLLESVHYMERNGLNPDSLMLFGQEKNLNTWAISKMSLFLHDIDDARIERGDTLRDPKHVSDEKTVMKFDLVMANPPFSMKNWGHEVWSKGDPFGRDKYGCPPKSYGDLAFVQHMIASLKPSGRMACVVPHGVLFRGGAEGKIRKGILEDDLIEAVVGLGPNLFYGTGIPAAILFVNRAKAAERRGSIIIVNGSEELVEGKKQNHLSDENVARMVGAVERWEDEELFCRVVSLDEIRENDHNLNLTRYVQTTPPPPPIDVAEEWRKLQELMAERDEAERRMTEFIEELGYGRRS
jgi:type I restriction enzyme M protein